MLARGAMGRSTIPRAVVAALLACSVVAGCAEAPRPRTTGVLDAGWAVCAAFDGGVPVGQSLATGTISGPAVSAAFCPGNSFATVEVYSPGSKPAFAFAALLGQVAFEKPSGVAYPTVSVHLQLDSLSPGDYSLAGGQCGLMFIEYFVADSSKPVQYSWTSPCPGDPVSSSSGGSGSPGSSGDGAASVGSWHLSLTSITPGADAANFDTMYYAPHGALTATLVSDDGGA
jgi:hypothetical protein